MSDLLPIRRALLSVSDKTGLVEFATALHREFGVELISTGGTARALRQAGLPVRDVSDVTGFPEMLDGRVKTLHPLIHGGLLALRDNPEHVQAMKRHGIEPIDLVCVNLYPFRQTIAKPDVRFEEAIENIDIGGPSMIRSAAKNHRFVLVVTSPEHYGKVLGDLREHGGSCCAAHRLKQARRAFVHTAEYDAAIAAYLDQACRDAARSDPPASLPSEQPQRAGEASMMESPVPESEAATLPAQITLRLRRRQILRYGENPHQQGALYVEDSDGSRGTLATAEQLHGKELSYINLLDADAALRCAGEFDAPAACIVKHATPCGVGTADSLAAAFEKAYAGDPQAAFGGIVALNRPVDVPAADAIAAGNKFLEVIVAPDYDESALELLKDRWKNVRLLRCGIPAQRGSSRLSLHSIWGGYLLQTPDDPGEDESPWRVASQRPPSETEMADLRIAWRVCKHVKSNAIVLVKDGRTVGIGGGQVDRVGAAQVAIGKAAREARGSVAASDAFFPFADGPQLLLEAGVTAIIQPGGSVRDSQTLAAVDAHGAAMILTGRRHFRH
ncbi:MAG: bifunctional phosphoribosylaminoimidazolecarboxamide formyltransferase/IMP cyclohydrolase [Phycisphaerae bacterium]|nr:bifunctional phosphoribosylaminoimidazolecarboxamide formyltransferase/IMP cyclohydrolase [Phycisphaerae bacterium]MDW8262153.1 bifunctional phosphoribosylaminoimidazolecarboxamide formyltransferase/IMP cyclohydrolase [Phycisphaerales bacterium]